MCCQKTMRWKKKSKVLKEVWNIIYKKKPVVSVVRKTLWKKNSSVRRTKQNWLMLVSNCTACDKKSQGSVAKIFLYFESLISNLGSLALESKLYST